MIKENLNIEEVREEFNIWLLSATIDYMDETNARFHIIFCDEGFIQAVIQ